MQEREPDAVWFAQAIANAADAAMSAGSLQELLLVLTRRGKAGSTELRDAALAIVDRVRHRGIRVVPVDEELALIGAIGSIRFGGKPARLNYGDGFAYALAKRLDAPILCKGDDFVHTDVQVLRPPRG